jgi:hypothetical protein
MGRWLVCCQNGLFPDAIRVVPVVLNSCTCTRDPTRGITWLQYCSFVTPDLLQNSVLSLDKLRLCSSSYQTLCRLLSVKSSNLHAQIVLQMHLATNLVLTVHRSQTICAVNLAHQAAAVFYPLAHTFIPLSLVIC